MANLDLTQVETELKKDYHIHTNGAANKTITSTNKQISFTKHFFLKTF